MPLEITTIAEDKSKPPSLSIYLCPRLLTSSALAQIILRTSPQADATSFITQVRKQVTHTGPYTWLVAELGFEPVFKINVDFLKNNNNKPYFLRAILGSQKTLIINFTF